MFQPGQKVVRKNDKERNKKWPDKYLDVPIRVAAVQPDGRLQLEGRELSNEKGWVASRFISASDPSFNPLKRFL